MNLPPYALVSPVRNEAKYIRHTLDSVISQTHLPVRWVIVSDGSTDETDEIVRQYAAEHPFIKLVRREPDGNRNFGSKVRAIEEGVSQLTGVEYEFLGNLDGDVSFAPEYFAQILERFSVDARLGVAGGILYDDHHGVWRRQIISVDSSVAGPIQLFRRTCYEQIGGYTRLPYGGVDAVAEGMARMHGWSVRTFPEIAVHHHRRVGTEGKHALHAFFDMGRREFVIGYHPVFGLVRAISRMRAVPWVIGGLCHGAGFFYAQLIGLKPALPDDYVQFLRREQIQRLLRRRSDN